MPPKLPIPCCAAMGNSATPHRHEHWQDPEGSVEPVPLATEGDGGAGAAAAAEEAGGGAAAVVPDGGAPAVAVPFCCMANDLNIAWVLSAVGLMLKVMPLPQ